MGITESCNINIDLVKEWNKLRKDQSQVRNIFQNASNKFSFTRDENTAQAIHIYIGYDGSALSFTIIDKIDDKAPVTKCSAFCSLPNANKISFPFFDPVITEGENQISWALAKSRIDNWKNDEIRNQWIENSFTHNQEILQVFSVQAVDISMGLNHDCFLALKDNNNSFSPDLIIRNSENDIILNAEDIVYPVPPFDNNNPQSAFGLLSELD